MAPVTTATVTEAGQYVFRLTAVDGSQTASATVTITFSLGLPAGTFISLQYLSALPQVVKFGCTTGFGVAKGTANSAVDYELEAKHCIDAEKGDQATNVDVNNTNQPMTIGQYPPFPPLTVYASSINCEPTGNACLLPAPVRLSGGEYETGDMMAWQPGSVVPSALVQTAYGLLPVVGAKDLSDVAQVCHYGLGSWQAGLNPPEQCGTAPGIVARYLICSSNKNRCLAGTQLFLAPALGGDSGGPVYSYDMVNGKPVGVFAIGIAISQGTTTGTILGVKVNYNFTVFIPIAQLESRLGVTLLAQAPLPSAPA